MEPELRALSGRWMARYEGLTVFADCGQEALLRLNIELCRQKTGCGNGARLVVEEVRGQTDPLKQPV